MKGAEGIIMEICLAYLVEIIQLKLLKFIIVVSVLTMALILSQKNITKKECILSKTLIYTHIHTHINLFKISV